MPQEFSLKLRYVSDDDQLVTEESRWRFLPTTIPFNMLYRYIVRQIQRVFQDFVLKDEYGRVLLHWKHRFSEQVIGPCLTSDGTLRFFCLATLLNFPEDRWPPLLMI